MLLAYQSFFVYFRYIKQDPLLSGTVSLQQILMKCYRRVKNGPWTNHPDFAGYENFLTNF